METFDGDLTHFQGGNAGDEKLYVHFYMGVVKDEGKSMEAGRPIFRDAEFVKIIIPGDKNNIIDREARLSDRVRFAQQYARFQQGHKDIEQTVGTRLSEWPAISRAQAEEYKHLNVHTVEQLAELRDDVALRVPGSLHLKRLAGVWLEKATKTAEAAKTTKLIEELQTQNATQQEAMRDLMAKNEKLMADLRKAGISV